MLHAGSFFGQRSPRPFLEAVAALDDPRIVARFLGDLRPADRDWALDLGLGDRLEIDGFRPHRETLAAMKAADVLLLLVPRAGGRGLSVLSGKVYEYLASERPVLALVPPEGAAADLLRATGAAWIADPDDPVAILGALRAARDAWADGTLAERTLDPVWRARLDRRTRAGEMAGGAARMMHAAPPPILGIQDDALLSSTDPSAWKLVGALGPGVVRLQIIWPGPGQDDQLDGDRPHRPGRRDPSARSP